MPKFEIKGKGSKTGRSRKRIYSAIDERTARERAEKDETIVEDINILPPEPPTENQLNYARDLNISIPKDANTDDASDLISMVTMEDSPASHHLKECGELFGIDFTDYIGKKLLFNKIGNELHGSDRNKEMLQWFIYRVYCDVSEETEEGIGLPNTPFIMEIVEEFIENKKVMKSIGGYSGECLIYFGEWEDENGYTCSGGSRRTIAYKEISLRIKDELNMSRRKNSSNLESVDNDSDNNLGCLSLIIITLSVSYFLTVTVYKSI